MVPQCKDTLPLKYLGAWQGAWQGAWPLVWLGSGGVTIWLVQGDLEAARGNIALATKSTGICLKTICTKKTRALVLSIQMG
jgi:hypothetical protein